MRLSSFLFAFLSALSLTSPRADAQQVNPQTTLACLGTRQPLVTVRNVPYVNFHFGASDAFFIVDTASTMTNVDPALFATPAPSFSSAPIFEAFSLNKRDWIPDILPQLQSPDTYSNIGMGTSGRKQQGMIASDVLKDYVVTLDYANNAMYMSEGDKFCTSEVLRGRNFLPANMHGYYGPLDNAHVAPAFTADVPLASVRISGIAGLAQFDSGLADDVVANSINVNKAYLDLLQLSGATLKRLPERDQDLKGKCAEKVEAYSATPSIDLEVAGTDGRSILTHKVDILFLKTAGGAGCGGIGVYQQAASQVGGSFLISGGTVIFDGPHSTAWFLQPSGARK